MTYTLINKPTLRVNGQMMFDMNITFAVSLEEVAYVIYHDFENNEADLTRPKILNKVAETLHYNGSSLWPLDEQTSEELETSERLARKFFPELKGK